MADRATAYFPKAVQWWLRPKGVRYSSPRRYMSRQVLPPVHPDIDHRPCGSSHHHHWHTPGPNLRLRTGRPYEWIAGWHRIRRSGVYIDTKDLSQKFGKILGPVFRISRGSAVAHSNVEVAVPAELQLSAIVIAVRLSDG